MAADALRLCSGPCARCGLRDAQVVMDQGGDLCLDCWVEEGDGGPPAKKGVELDLAFLRGLQAPRPAPSLPF